MANDGIKKLKKRNVTNLKDALAAFPRIWHAKKCF